MMKLFDFCAAMVIASLISVFATCLVYNAIILPSCRQHSRQEVLEEAAAADRGRFDLDSRTGEVRFHWSTSTAHYAKALSDFKRATRKEVGEETYLKILKDS